MALNKKGQDLPLGFLGWTILILIFLIVALGIWYYIQVATEKLSTEKACQSSVLIRTQAGKTVGSNIPFLCATNTQKVTSDPEEIKKTIGELMASCETQFLRGEYEDLFSGWIPKISTQNGCFVCYYFTAPKLDKPIEAIAIKEFLYQNKYTKDQLYIDYLENQGRIKLGILAGVESGETYGVAFSSKAKAVSWSKLGTETGITLGGAVLTYFSPVGKTYLGGVTLINAYSLAADAVTKFYKESDKSTIYFDTYNNMKNNCAIYEG